MRLVILAFLLPFGLLAGEHEDWGKWWVQSDPAGATVVFMQVKRSAEELAKPLAEQSLPPYMPDTVLGKTPCLVRLPKGTHAVALTMEGRLPIITEVVVRSLEIVKSEVFKLGLPVVSVDVMFDKPGWEVYIDGEPYLVGGKVVTAPATVRVSEGKHRLELVKGELVVSGELGGKLVDLSKEQPVKRLQKKVESESATTTADNSIENLDFTNYTVEQWNKFVGPVVVVSAKQELNTGVILKQGQRLVILPHPTDEWRAGVYEIHKGTYKGTTELVGGVPLMCLCYRIGAQTGKYGIVSGTGNLILYAHDNKYSDNQGNIRVKLVPVSEK